jgi:hypothetical protein
MLLIYFGHEPNEITNFFFICCKIKEKKKLDTKKFFAETTRNETFQKGYNLINGVKLWCQIIRTSWSHGHTTHTQTPIPRKPSKSGLIAVWHKNNLYLSTITKGNRKPPPNDIDSRTRSIRMTPQRQLFFNKSFFSSLENHVREIISPTHTHTQSAVNKFY